MILADKIIRLRKKNGWSQEELAEKVDVSRQAVAKWESAQTVPNLDKILQLGTLFGVTTDYLLKDEIEMEEFLDSGNDSNLRRVTLAEANAFLEWRKSASIRIAVGTLLCILSVIPLFILGARASFFPDKLSEASAALIGMVILFVMVAAAVGIFIHCGFRNAPYEFLDKEEFETEYGVIGMVRERQKAYKGIYAKCNMIGTCICILSPIPLFMGAFTENEFYVVFSLTGTIFLAGIAVLLFIIVGVRWASMQKLLKEGEFAPSEKWKNRIKESVATIYWLTAAAIYIGWSLVTDDWQSTWVVWPIAGVLFAGAVILCNLLISRKR